MRHLLACSDGTCGEWRLLGARSGVCVRHLLACSDGMCGEWGPLGARSVCVCGTSWPVVTGCAVSGGGWMLGAGRDGAGCVRHLLHQRGG